MSDLSSWATAAQDWLRANVTGTPSSFAESRVTRTPVVVRPMQSNMGGAYNPDILANDAVNASGSEKSLRDALAMEWAGRRGVISLNSEVLNNPRNASRILRHEQLHQIFDRGGLGQSAEQLAPLVKPSTVDFLSTNPLYKVDQGIVANEGTAYDLSDYISSPELGLNKKLRDEVIRLLAEKGQQEQAQQVRRLTK